MHLIVAHAEFVNQCKWLARGKHEHPVTIGPVIMGHVRIACEALDVLLPCIGTADWPGEVGFQANPAWLRAAIKVPDGDDLEFAYIGGRLRIGKVWIPAMATTALMEEK